MKDADISKSEVPLHTCCVDQYLQLVTTLL